MRKHSPEAFLRSIQEKTWLHPLFYVLLVVSVLYRLGNYLHRGLYRWRILSYAKANAYVVSIGNVTWGGGGKTSLIELLGNAVPTLAIVCKNMSGQKGVIEVDEGLPAEVVGDEALLHAKNVKHADVFSCESKWEGVLRAAKNEKLIFVDDGMQHYKLWRDLEIVCINGNEPFGNGHLIPAGPLREPKGAIHRADYIFINNADKKRPHPLVTKVSAPVIEVAYMPKVTLPQKAVAFCGVGAPDSFFQMLKEHDVELVDTYTLDDHATISAKKLQQLQKIGVQKGATAILCTEKDFVKMNEFVSSPLPVKPVLCELEIVRGAKAFETLVRAFQFHAERES